MCEPSTIAMAGISLASSAAQVGQQNDAAAQNRANALQAQNDQIDSQGRQYVEQNRTLIQGAFDNVLAGREGEADAFTSAIANGVQGRSVRAMLADRKQTAARNSARQMQESEGLRDQTGANFRNIRSRTQGRINQVPTTSLGLGDFASALSPIVKYEFME